MDTQMEAEFKPPTQEVESNSAPHWQRHPKALLRASDQHNRRINITQDTTEMEKNNQKTRGGGCILPPQALDCFVIDWETLGGKTAEEVHSTWAVVPQFIS